MLLPACGSEDSPPNIEGDQPGECTDDADNDRDGLFDCRDPDCAGSAACSEATEPGDGVKDPSAPIRSSLFPDQSNRWAQGRIPPAKQPDSGEDVLGFGGLSAAAQATFANASPGGNPSSVSQSSTLVPVSCS